MALPDPAYRRYRDAYLRGEQGHVRAHGDALAVRLAADPAQRGLVPAVVLMHGMVLAAADELVSACDYLEQGLAMLPGTESAREAGTGDDYALALVQCEVLLGRYDAALGRLTALEEPDRPVETRLGAIRARAQIAGTRGDDEQAHWLLNTATNLASRMRSRFSMTLVDADRALVLAIGGRVHEGVRLADSVLGPLTRPGRGNHPEWAAAEAAALALTLSRLTADRGDLATAERMLLTGAAATDRVPRPLLDAHLDLAISVLWRQKGAHQQAEPLLRDAVVDFVRLGCRPAAALGRVAEGHLAWARGMRSAAVPLYEQARTEFADLGHRRDVAELTHLLRLADAQGAPSRPPVAGGPAA